MEGRADRFPNTHPSIYCMLDNMLLVSDIVVTVVSLLQFIIDFNTVTLQND